MLNNPADSQSQGRPGVGIVWSHMASRFHRLHRCAIFCSQILFIQFAICSPCGVKPAAIDGSHVIHDADRCSSNLGQRGLILGEYGGSFDYVKIVNQAVQQNLVASQTLSLLETNSDSVSGEQPGYRCDYAADKLGGYFDYHWCVFYLILFAFSFLVGGLIAKISSRRRLSLLLSAHRLR